MSEILKGLNILEKKLLPIIIDHKHRMFIFSLARQLPFDSDPAIQSEDGQTIDIFWLNPHLSIVIYKHENDYIVSVDDFTDGEHFEEFKMNDPKLLPYIVDRYTRVRTRPKRYVDCAIYD